MPRDHQEVQRLEAEFGGEEGLKVRGTTGAQLSERRPQLRVVAGRAEMWP